jgi:hypothetical protein
MSGDILLSPKSRVSRFRDLALLLIVCCVELDIVRVVADRDSQ